MSFSHAELDFLLSPTAGEAIEHAGSLELSKRSMLADVAALQKRWGAGSARALVELATARRGLGRKFSATWGAREWFVDSAAAQQATPSPVAEFRAALIADFLSLSGAGAALDVTCSVGTELRALSDADHRSGGTFQVFGSDLDLQRVRMALRNVPEAGITCADALEPAWNPELLAGSVVIADPARRDSSGRIARVEDLMPPLPDVVETYVRRGGAELAIKCAPGIDFSEFSEWAGMVDVFSIDREVKEACAYTPGLANLAWNGGSGAGSGMVASVDGGQADAEHPVAPTGEAGAGPARRRAIVMRGGGETVEVYRSDMPHEHEDERAAGPVGTYIIDPDGAVVRAGLVRHYAAAHGLWQLDPRIAYLTGDRIPPGERGFEVLEQVPVKRLKHALAAHGAKAVEILIRGIDADPDVLRKKWKLKGGKSAGVQGMFTVVVTGVGENGVGYICRAQAG